MERLLEKDVVLKVVAVLLAVFLWVQATAELNPVEQFTFDGIGVVPESVPEGLVVMGNPRPAKVNIAVRCRTRVREKLTSSDFAALVSLEGGHAGTYDYPVEVSAPEGVELVEISPTTVSVTLEEVATAEVPVRVELAGTCPEGYAAGEVSVVPAVVTARGPVTAVSRVVRAVAHYDLSSATGDVSQVLTVIPVDAGGSRVPQVGLVPSEVTMSLPVFTLPPPESLDIDPTLVGSPAEGYAVLRVRCVPDRASVRPRPGEVVAVDRLHTEPVDISGRTADVTATVKVVVPPEAASVTPGEVDVTVEIGPARALSGLPVAVRNVAQGLEAEVRPQTVSLVITGPRNLLDRLGAGDVSAWVDASGRGSGTYSALVEVDLPAWSLDRLEVFICNPPEVTLILGP
ncbi:MAG TPA: hypothetical protein DHW14_07935 [Clostridiales bacterium]|nr:hypothetical protein [Clostridiales bacterium]